MMRSLLLILAVVSATFGGGARAEEKYPSRPIRIVVGFSPGGGNDIIARIFGQKLSESTGQPVIVENKPGAGGMVATAQVARSAPDGYTLLMGASGAMVVNPAVYEKLNYDTEGDFAPVSLLGTFPLILIVNKASPIKSVDDLVAYAKQNPKSTNYSSSSTSFQLATELFKLKTGAPMQMIPYKGTNDSITALLAGEVTATIADAGPASSQILGGEARALAVTSPKRIDALSDVPTMKEAGVDIETVLWSGIFVPKATPPEMKKKLEAEFMRIGRLPEVAERLKLLSIDTIGSSSEDFSATIAADLVKWRSVAREAEIKITQ